MASVVNPLQAALGDSNATSKEMGLRQKLEQSWSGHHGLIRHADQPKISFLPEQLKRMYQSSKCFNAGFCVCKNASKPTRRTNSDALLFEQKLIMLMKKEFWSKTINEKKEKSPVRILLEAGAIVLHFSSIAEGEEGMNRNTFFHIGYMNFKTWAMSTLRLFPSNEEDMFGDVGEKACLTVGSLHETDGTAFLMLRDAIRNGFDIDLKSPCVVQFFRLVGGTDPLPISEMLPGKNLKCEALDCLGTTSIWKGSREERKDRRLNQKKKKRKGDGEIVTNPRKVQKKMRYDVEFNNDLGIGLIQEAAAVRRPPPPVHVNEPDSDSSSSATVSVLAEPLDNPHANEEAGSESDLASLFDNLDDPGPGIGSDPENDASFLRQIDETIDGDDGDYSPSIAPADAAADDVDPDEQPVAELPAPAEEQPNAGGDDGMDAIVAAGLGFARRPGVCEIRFVTTSSGEIRYNIMSQFYRAHCPVHFGEQCMRRRTAIGSDRSLGQGRPLGLLMFWLETAHQFDSKEAHMRAGPGSFDERSAARSRLLAMPGAVDFAKHERQRRSHEKSDEPSRVP